MAYKIITVDFTVTDVGAATTDRFEAILDRLLPGDEAYSAPQRLGGDGGILGIESWAVRDLPDDPAEQD